MDDLQKEIAALRELAQQAPTKERRDQAVASLQHKREGLQALALKALGVWGGRESVETIREFLVEAFARPFGWAIRGVAIRSVIPLVESKDAEWVLDLYFSLPDHLQKHELLWLVTALPPDSVRGRLVKELSSPDWANRHAAVKAIGNVVFADRRTLISPLLDDVNEVVRSSAELLLSRRDQLGRVW